MHVFWHSWKWSQFQTFPWLFCHEQKIKPSTVSEHVCSLCKWGAQTHTHFLFKFISNHYLFTPVYYPHCCFVWWTENMHEVWIFSLSLSPLVGFTLRRQQECLKVDHLPDPSGLESFDCKFTQRPQDHVITLYMGSLHRCISQLQINWAH